MATVLSNFQQVVNDAMYDYAFTYRATENKAYTGRVTYMAEWKGMESGKGDYSIGTAETPWPLKAESAGDAIVKILIALLMAMLTFAFFFLVMKVIIPFFKSKKFSAQYYKSYVPEANVQRRICTCNRTAINVWNTDRTVRMASKIMWIGKISSASNHFVIVIRLWQAS